MMFSSLDTAVENSWHCFNLILPANNALEILILTILFFLSFLIKTLCKLTI